MGSSADISVAIVDDDDSLCRSIGRLLRTEGIQLVTYHSAESFLADTNRPRFDCLLLDVQLEGMSGIELNQRLKSESATIPVIFNTAHDEPEIRQRAAQTGYAAYLLKTDPGTTVLAAIRSAVKPGVADGSIQAEHTFTSRLSKAQRDNNNSTNEQKGQ